jgi:hypothetical protein
MKLLKKIVTRLYEKYGDVNWTKMTRLQLQGTTFEQSPENLNEKDRKVVANNANTVLRNEAFKLAINNVKSKLENHIRYEATDAQMIFYDRMTINGVALLENELQSYADMDIHSQEPYNKFSAL